MIPNIITTIRLILVPIIIILMIISPINNDNFYHLSTISITINNYTLPVSWLIAAIFFIIATISDFIDGWWARKFNQVTIFGKFFDSIADKLLTNGVLIVMACATIIPIWMAVILVLRDFIIDVVRQILASKGVIMAADKYGKIKAAVEMLGIIILFFINWQFLNGNVNGHDSNDQYGLINQLVMIPMYIATILSIYSAYHYINLNAKSLFSIEKNKGVLT
ncbi:CDP-diacylglycerol--glycerol-3-phosphate 3-phosphatidyltransferase [Spiroplasma endosymbiont of Polydrusus pterygomalis]|uniref:CDP-diacylglycerol--glycerol-3-phosphate 3-phosphatidyltransferase n=1 Tax=Spiroplasma endosymbiont of Polydrusus pterygomalis TaxID=3139327 RepID=UPI003CCB32EB